MKIALAIFVGGGLGSLCRYGMGRLAQLLVVTNFPIGTFLSNLLSCLLLALIVGLWGDKWGSGQWMRFLLITGFCGGFSTFSTFSYETFELFRTGHSTLAVSNILISVITGVGVIWLLLRNQSHGI